MLRAVVVIGLSALVIGLTVPNLWVPLYFLGTGLDNQQDVTYVFPGSAAQAAGLREGDHVEPRSLPTDEWIALSYGYAPMPGETLRFVVDRGKGQRTITMRAPLTVAPPFDDDMLLVKRAAEILFVLLAAILLFLRPSAMLWGFFLFALGSAVGEPLVLLLISASALIVGTAVMTAIQLILGPIGLLMFSTRFPVPSVRGWRAVVAHATPLISVLLVACAIEVLIPASLPIALPSWLDLVEQDVYVSVITVGVATLFAGFIHMDAPHRQQLRWVVAGFAVYYAAIVYLDLLGQYLPDQGWPPAWSNAGWTPDVLFALVVFIPLTVAYAVLKHRVLDLNFVLGRGLVYGIITSIAIAVFAVIDWLLGTVLARTQLAVAGEVMAAIAIGFWLNGIHRGVDRFVDSVIFRRRHMAEVRLARVAAGLPHAETYDTVAGMLVREPVEALGLVSAALFRRLDGGGFGCERSMGLRSNPARLESNDPLAVHLHGERGPILLHQLGWKFPDGLDREQDPAIAFPVFVRHELSAIVFYGGHLTGEAIDPDELRTLESLCVAASAAFDHLEAVELRRRLDASEHALSALAQQMRVLKGAPAGG